MAYLAQCAPQRIPMTLVEGAIEDEAQRQRPPVLLTPMTTAPRLFAIERSTPSSRSCWLFNYRIVQICKNGLCNSNDVDRLIYKKSLSPLIELQLADQVLDLPGLRLPSEFSVHLGRTPQHSERLGGSLVYR